MKQTINGAELRQMIISAAASIEINKQALNELNVFPVPDGDTGTNMAMTIHSAATELRKLDDPTPEQAAAAVLVSLTSSSARPRTPVSRDMGVSSFVYKMKLLYYNLP